MQETIKGYNGEIDSIKLVVDKLVTKQNSSVFDKLCNMVNNLFNRMTNYNASELTQDDIKELIAAFKRMLEISITLYNYREYLIAVVNQNISDLENLQTEQKNTVENNSTLDSQPAATAPAINDIEEVSADSLSNVVSLNLTNNDQKNAA
ncbi:MAG: hypothetical protein OSJ70_09680 [Bacilli bacterium]|nr:hypothetical protein [Bacilli bacterium]